MGTRARPSQLRPHAGVTAWQAEQARRAARAGNAPGLARRYGWPADREAIVAEMVAAVRDGNVASEARDSRAGDEELVV